MINPFPERQQPKGWVLSLSIVMMFVGVLISMTWITEKNRQDRLSRLSPDVRARLSVGDLDLSEEYTKLQMEVTKLRDETTRLQGLAAEGNSASKEINESLKDTKVFAALTDVEGQGVTVTLSDSRKAGDELGDYAAGIVHDLDVLKVTNELWNAGAEAISINGKRVGPGTNVRCVGTTIHIDEQKIATPVSIQAIGDSKVLFGALNMPGGALEELRDVDPAMVKIEVSKTMFLPAWTGATTLKYARPVEDKADQGGSSP